MCFYDEVAYIDRTFKQFSQLPIEIRYDIWDLVASEMIPDAGRLIEIPCEADMMVGARLRLRYGDDEPLPGAEEFLESYGPELMPRLRMKYELSDYKKDRVDISSSDVESDYLYRHPAMLVCHESRKRLLHNLVYMQHPNIPTSGFLMHPPSDVLTLDCLTTAEQLRLIKKYYPEEKLSQIQAIILDESGLWQLFIDEEAEMPFHLSDVLDIFQGVKLLILYSHMGWWHEDGPDEHKDRVRMIKGRDGKYVAWLKDRGISVEYHDEDGTVYGII